MTDTEPKKKFWTFRRVLIVIGIFVVPLLGFALYTAFTLSWSYSEGERSGILQKISLKGWVCKTYEGELAVTTQPGIAPLIWNFSVRDAKISNDLNGALGKSVVLHYEEHPGLPTSCFGETQYFVTQVQVAEIQR